MPKLAFRTTSFAAIVVIAAAMLSCAGDAVDMSAKQAQLGRFIGTWYIDTTLFKAEWTPEETHKESTYKSEWILDGKFVRQSSSDYLKLYTFDAAEDTFRYWFFAADGIAVDALGDWDEATQSFVWKSTVGPGLAATVTHHFVNDDTIELTIIIRNSVGKVYYHSQSKSKRVK